MYICGWHVDRDLLLQLDDRRACAALIGRGGREVGDVRMAAQEVGDGAAERARAVTVDDAYVAEAVQICFVEKFVNGGDGFIGCAADQVQLNIRLMLRFVQAHLCGARMTGGHA